jgi:hypothetical protein
MDRAEIAERVLQAVERWRDKYQPSCAESIYQVDACTIAATELVEDTLNIAGYAADGGAES